MNSEIIHLYEILTKYILTSPTCLYNFIPTVIENTIIWLYIDFAIDGKVKSLVLVCSLLVQILDKTFTIYFN